VTEIGLDFLLYFILVPRKGHFEGVLTASSLIIVIIVSVTRRHDMRRLNQIVPSLVATAMVFVANSAHAQAVSVEVDQSKPLRFDSPVTGVVVGNAGIADVIVHDSKTLFVIGKSVGTTHVLAVDQRGRTVFSGNVAVSAAQVNNLLTVQRGRELATSICDARCIAYPDSEATTSAMSDAAIRAKNRSAFASGRN
jgi:Flp pilus assembly secretin CpaC